MSHIIKFLVFISLLGLFWTAGGLSGSRLAREDYRDPVRMGRAWSYTVLLFVVGAGVAVWGDKTVGTLYPQSFRALYIILGVLLMLAGLLWMRMIKSTNTAAAHQPNHSIQQPETSRSAINPIQPQGRLAPVAHPNR